MKKLEQRYREAVERNLLNAEKRPKEKYKGMKIEDAKMRMGIRANDFSYDDQVSKLIK